MCEARSCIVMSNQAKLTFSLYFWAPIDLCRPLLLLLSCVKIPKKTRRTRSGKRCLWETNQSKNRFDKIAIIESWIWIKPSSITDTVRSAASCVSSQTFSEPLPRFHPFDSYMWPIGILQLHITDKDLPCTDKSTVKVSQWLVTCASMITLKGNTQIRWHSDFVLSSLLYLIFSVCALGVLGAGFCVLYVCRTAMDSVLCRSTGSHCSIWSRSDTGRSCEITADELKSQSIVILLHCLSKNNSVLLSSQGQWGHQWILLWQGTKKIASFLNEFEAELLNEFEC